MCISFNLRNESRGPLAVKISVGRVNALTDLRQNMSAKGTQDYLPIGEQSGQLGDFPSLFPMNRLMVHTMNLGGWTEFQPHLVSCIVNRSSCYFHQVTISPLEFVAMPLGKGYTVEEQVNETDNVNGIQIDVFPKYDATRFELGRNVNMYKTARQLGLEVGESIQLTPRWSAILKNGLSCVVNPQHQLLSLWLMTDLEI
ncbi:hypothetical protein PAXRUDRAFT_831551 [Paxillus rubicundulus Ve08.2h10]|uniref:Unplaced genomic scaffold scaffold_672, whole genome shotgun sequence n=1 Tax=Paxillus rubicundulus Ve08.2h10 TaxID=930991 RepID=A0A0D0DI37_9AGAM|nr:hypothetical protein PAXRUDRAFT_831551 [Paxillus rubicundulus Ve08.2h10]